MSAPPPIHSDLAPGEFLRVSQRHQPDWSDPRVRSLLEDAFRLSAVSLDHALSDSTLAEMAIVREITTLFGCWAERAKRTRVLQEVQEYYAHRELTTTANCWVPDADGGEHISNAVYTMRMSCMPLSQDGVPVHLASWTVRLKLPSWSDAPPRLIPFVQLAGHWWRPFPTERDALAYLEDQRTAYADLFTEEFPPIPQEHADRFRLHGVLPPPYRIAQTQRVFPPIGHGG